MSEKVVTLRSLIEHAEEICVEKFGSVGVAKALMAERYAKKPMESWAYFDSLNALSCSNGTLESSREELTKHHRLRVQSKQHDKRLLEEDMQVG